MWPSFFHFFRFIQRELIKVREKLRGKYFLNIFIYFMCASVLPACADGHGVSLLPTEGRGRCEPAAHRGKRRGPDPLELELEMAVSCHVGGNQVLCKSSQCFELLSPLFLP